MAVREGDLIVPALRLLANTPNGFMTTSDLIAGLEAHFQPTGLDAQLLQGRFDSHFSQKVRNLVSHRNNSTGLEARGLAEYDAPAEGWHIQSAGRLLVDDLDAGS